MKKIMGILLVMVIGLSLAAQPAFAGSKQRYRWQGVAIGVGAAILGHAIYNSCKETSSCEKVTVYSHPCPPHHRYGHWEIRRVWVEPVYKRVWNPGHYDCRGKWVPGHWQMIEKQPGCWQEQEVWVAGK